jgi:hypothetical protein
MFSCRSPEICLSIEIDIAHVRPCECVAKELAHFLHNAPSHAFAPSGSCATTSISTRISSSPNL